MSWESKEVFDVVLRNSACTDSVDVFNTPVTFALQEKQETIVELLLKEGSQEIAEYLYLAFKNINTNGKIVELHLSHTATFYFVSIFERLQNVTPLHIPVPQGGKIIVFLARAVINPKIKQGERPVCISSKKGNLQIVGCLVNCDASYYYFMPSFYQIGFGNFCDFHLASVKSYDGLTLSYMPLYDAAFQGKYEGLKFLISCDTDVNVQGYNDRKLLHFTIEKNYYNFHTVTSISVKSLLYKKPVDIATKNCKASTLKFIFLQRLSIDSCDNEQARPNSVDLCGYEILQRLLDCGFSIMDLVKSIKVLNAVAGKGCLKTLEKLIEFGADVNATVNYVRGYSLLHVAVINRKEDICKLLLDNNANVNIKDRDNEPPIFYAIKSEDFNITKLLFEAVPTEVVIETFNYAIDKGFLKIVESILQHDISFNVNAYDSRGRTPLHCIALIGSEEMSYSLDYSRYESSMAKKKRVKSGFNEDEGNRRAIVELLLSRGADVNALVKKPRNPFNEDPCFSHCSSQIGFSALFAGAVIGFENVVQSLLKYKADVNALCGDFTPLLAATSGGHVGVVEILLNYNCDYTLMDSKGRTALHIACERKYDDIVTILLEFVSEIDSTDIERFASPYFINCRNKEGFTPFMIAAQKGHIEIANTLFNYGADINARDNRGKTALHFAAVSGHSELIQNLLMYGCDINITSENGSTPIQYVDCFWQAIQSDRFHLNDNIRRYDDDDVNDLIPVDMECMSPFEEIIEVFKNYIKKLKAANLYLSHANDAYTNYNIYCGYAKGSDVYFFTLDDCLYELETMKLDLITKNLSYYDIVTKSMNELEIIARNNYIVCFLCSTIYSNKYPIYSDIVHGRFQMAIKRNNLIKECCRFTDSVSSDFSGIPYLCMEKILSYLNMNDLKLFIISCRHSHFSDHLY